jgi:antitoxin component YwqK of YwqJK toxin-antitoxin module
MEHRVQSLNKLLLLFWAAIVVITFYSSARPKTIKDTWVSTTDTHLVYMNGFLYYKKKVYTGWLFENFDNGNRAKEIPYYGGKIDGTMKTWYPDNTQEQERLFVSGEKQGVHRGWWPNGKPKFEYNFVDDEHEGLAKEWYSNNKLYRAFHYQKGHEQGQQQMWWEDGSVRANYVVKNNRQYGLIGRKLCRNIYKK